jgi:hypothetical protein
VLKKQSRTVLNPVDGEEAKSRRMVDTTKRRRHVVERLPGGRTRGCF